MAGMLCLVFTDRSKNIVKAAAFLITLASLAGSIYVFAVKPLYFRVADYPVLAADNLSSLIAIAVAFFAFLVTVYSFGFIESPSRQSPGFSPEINGSRFSKGEGALDINPKGLHKSFGNYFGYVLITLGSSIGVAFAANLVVLLIFWAVLAVMLYLLVNMQGTDRACASAKKALIIIGGTDAVMMFGIVLIWAMTGTFSMDRINLKLDSAPAMIAYFSLAVTAFAKAGAMPFHSWLPDVAEDGPSSVTAYLPASLDKLLGIYLLARISLDLFVMNNVTNLILAALGSVTIILAVMMALVQHDLKRLLGYHAVSQVGYMILGIGTGNPIGIAGGLFHMLNNAVYKTCLFLTGGSVEKKTGTTDLGSLGALAKYMPITFACFLIASLSISGVPPFNGFVSKWMIYQGIIESAGRAKGLWIIWLSAAMFGSALTIASFMKLLHAIFLGRPSRDYGDLKEARFSMTAPVVALAAVCVIFGVFAFALPLRLFIAPAMGGDISYSGAWSPVAATALLLAGLAIGVLAYYLTGSAKYRRVEPFVGGAEAGSLGRVSGTDFYKTISDIKGLGAFYKKEESKDLDIYTLGGRSVRFFTRIFQHLHNGVLPTYMVWCLLGMTGLFIFIFFR